MSMLIAAKLYWSFISSTLVSQQFHCHLHMNSLFLQLGDNWPTKPGNSQLFDHCMLQPLHKLVEIPPSFFKCWLSHCWWMLWWNWQPCSLATDSHARRVGGWMRSHGQCSSKAYYGSLHILVSVCVCMHRSAYISPLLVLWNMYQTRLRILAYGSLAILIVAIMCTSLVPRLP